MLIFLRMPDNQGARQGKVIDYKGFFINFLNLFYMI
jgi:hypothetical protein